MALFLPATVPARDSNGSPSPSAVWKFYREDSTTPLAVDGGSETVTANTSGVFAEIELAEGVGDYRAVLVNAQGRKLLDITSTADSLFAPGTEQAFDSGVIVPGALWKFYTTATTTPRPVYSTDALAVSLGSSVQANAAGVFPEIHLDPAITYKAVLEKPDGTAIATIDPVTATSMAEYLYPVLSITAASADKYEGDSGTTPFTFTVTRSGRSTTVCSCNWAMTGSGGSPANATDFGGTLGSGSLTFAAGETSKTITVNVSGDTTNESDETFTVTLSSAAGAAFGTSTAVGTIRTDDFSPMELPVGDAGVTEGFLGDPLVSGYTATAGRYRLDLDTAGGFVICAADEERLCYNADGTFRGQYLEGADTYYSAPWHDPAAPHTSSDPAYLTTSAGGTIDYAGAHAENDIFGGTGGGVVITQTATTNGIFQASNVRLTPVAVGDVMRHHMIVAITGATMTGVVSLRGAGNAAFGVSFNHDAAGLITSVAEAWATYRAGFHDMGTINGKRWFYLWLDRKAANTSDQVIAVGFGSGTADTGKKYHICEMMLQKNPATPPTAVPVCAAAKTFAADTLATSIGSAGVAFDGLCMARSKATAGAVAPPAISVGAPYEPLETRIEIFPTTESSDVGGILPNYNSRFYTRPWLSSGATWTVNLGPGYFAGKWERTNETGGSTSTFKVQPVFTGRRDLRPVLGRASTVIANLGTLDTDDCIHLGLGDKTTANWEQVSIDSSNTNMDVMFGLRATTNIYARNALFMGCSLHTTRARHEIQEDDTPEPHAYVGAVVPTINSTGTMDFSGTRFERIARFAPNASAQATQVSLNINDTCFNMVWSDTIYWARGTFTNAQASRRFHGRMTFIPDLTLFQSRKQIEVDTGSGFVDFLSSGLTIPDLPHGYEAVKVGTWDFNTNTFTSAPDATKKFRLRYFRSGSLNSPIIDREGYQWHASPIYTNGYSQGPSFGEVYEVDTGSVKLRITHDTGYWKSGPTWQATSSVGAQGATGTHGDNSQVNRTDVTINGMTADDVLMMNNGQGPFHTGRVDWASTANVSGITGVVNNRLIGVFDAIYNMYRTEHSKTVASNETINESLFITAYSPLRDGTGKGYGGWAYAAGVNNTITFGPDVTTATPGGGFADHDANGTIVGTTNHINLPSLQDGTVTPGTGTLTGLLNPGDIHSTGQASPTIDPWTFTFPDTAEAILGWDANATLTLVRGDHAEWDTVIADLAAVYHREPDFVASVSASASVGDVVASGITATDFHPRYSGMEWNSSGVPYFVIDGTDLKVNAALTGLNKIFVLRGDNDETYMVDVA